VILYFEGIESNNNQEAMPNTHLVRNSSITAKYSCG
jgi:hypothetical protein